MNIPNVELMLLRIPGLLLAMSVHEAAHAYVAYKQGDNLPKLQGRLTLNPLAHVDILGMVSLMLFGFGWAKPVQTNPYNYKNPKVGMGFTSLAGPLSNLISAIILIIFLKAAVTYKLINNYYLLSMIEEAYHLNIFFAIFNMLPIPPLDGSKVLFLFLPHSYADFVMRNEMIGQLLLIICLVFAPYLLSYILTPAYLAVNGFIQFLLNILPF